MCVPYVYFLKQVKVLTLLYTGLNLKLHYKHLCFIVLNKEFYTLSKKNSLPIFQHVSCVSFMDFIQPHFNTVGVP